nr:caspase family protein [Pleurocapsa sp. MO_226.B13]
MVKVKRKALLIGISEYGHGIPNLEIVPNDIEILQQSLEKSGFKVQPLSSSDGKDVTKAAIRKAIATIGKSDKKFDTLIIYFSGHGIHYQDQGKDYIVTGDASREDLKDPDLCHDYLFSPAELNKLLASVQAQTIVVFVDACREGVKLIWEDETKGIVLAEWGEENQWRGGQSTVFMFACQKGQKSQYFGGNSEQTGYSLFTKALANVIHPDCSACKIQQVLQETQARLDQLIKQYQKKPHKIRCISSEHGADFNPMSQVICEGSSTSIAAEKDRNPWTDTILQSSLWSTEETADSSVAELKRQIIKVVQRCWQEWETAVQAFPEDPWRDEKLPVRAVEALELLVSCSDPPIQLSSPEIALLLVIPFVREAVLASGIVQAAEVNPLELVVDSTKNDLRRALEQTHQMLPRFVRRVERLEASEDLIGKNAVMVWMLHRCLLRSLKIWQPQAEGGYLSNKLIKSLQPSNNKPKLVRDVLKSERLLELAKSMFADLERIERQDRPGALQPKVTVGKYGQEQDLRERLLAYMLNLAGWLAIDIRTLSDVVVDHIGLSNPINPRKVLQTISDASWRPFAKGRAFVATCDHPAVDLALNTHVENADVVLSQVLQKADELVELDTLKGLPSYLKSDRIEPESKGGKWVYKTPHIKFQLAHDEIRELLMGEQLYGDPTLAIRELYQNALDACRYREARLKYLKQTGQYSDPNWQGKIIFRQGYENGRPFIECEDNGIGMGMLHLSQCFARSGRRFTELSEFIEEQADWLKLNPPIHLYPNSQFGIGVLSYFMLADEIMVETCRMNQRGFPEDSLLVLIPGSSGLFQIQEGTRNNSGTKVRLYLNRTHYDNERISCFKVLKKLLWVAEFKTEVHELDTQNQQTLKNRWEAGQLQHPNLSSEESCKIGNSDIWWISNFGEGQVLADGILTDEQHEFVVVNLRHERYPRLTVDRKSIVEWENNWVSEEILRQRFNSLQEWSHLTFAWLWDLEDKTPYISEKVVDFLIQENALVKLELDNFKRQIPKIYIAITGCSIVDEQFLRSWDDKASSFSSDFPTLPKYLLFRAKLWQNLLSSKSLGNWHSNLWPVLRPGDDILLSQDLNDRERDRYSHWLEGTVPPLHLLRASGVLKRPVSEIVERLQLFVPFGLE